MPEDTVGVPNAETEVPQNNAEELEVANPEGGDDIPQATENEDEHGERPKKLGGWQRKIVKLEAELDKWRDAALNFAQKTPTVEDKKTSTPAEDKRPRKEDFIVDANEGTYDADAYEEAVDAWRDRQYDKKLASELEKRDQVKARQSEQSKIEQTWQEKEAAVKAKYPDYTEHSTTAVQFLQAHRTSVTVQAIGAAITESANPELLRALGEDYETLERISKLSPTAAVREIGKLEARLDTEVPAKQDEANDERTTEPSPLVAPLKKGPPKPPTPVKRTTAVDNGELRDDLPPDEWARRYDKKMQAFRQRGSI